MFTKKMLHIFVLVGVLGSLFGLAPMIAQAQTGAPADENALPFHLFGYGERILHGPYDVSGYTFGIPAEWELQEGSKLQLDLAVFFDRANLPEGVDQRAVFGGAIQVLFNGEALDTLLLEEPGRHTIEITIPSSAHIPTYSQQRHQLELILINDEYCLYGIETTVVIEPTSRLIMPHQKGSVPLVLNRLPWPIYQKGSYQLQSAKLVVPDQPTADELQAAFAVSAGFGRMSNGELLLSMLTEGQLTAEILAANSLIFVGQADHFAHLSEISWKVPVDQLVSQYPASGLLEITNSPWSVSHAILLVSGGTVEGVIKGAQAVSSGVIVGNIQAEVAVVDEINPTYLATLAPVDRTLADLGYQTEVINRIGYLDRNYEFFVPPGMVAEGNAYFDLSYAHSGLINYDQSGLAVFLNGEPIGSNLFGDATKGEGQIQIYIPKDTLYPGMNVLNVQAELVPIDPCANFLEDNMWLTIREESLLHLPLMEAPPGVTQRYLDLGNYPDLLSLSSMPGSVAFVVPQASSVAWEVASQLAFDLGNRTNWSIAQLEAAYTGAIDGEIQQNYDLVFVGRPSALAEIATLGDSLPAPFDSGSDVPREQNLQVVYLISPSSDVGMLELFPSPWNAAHAILAVLGTTDQGVRYGGAGLADPEVRGQVAGDFAVLYADQPISGDTDYSVAVTVESVTIAPVGVETAVTASSPARPAWVLPVLGVVLLLILAIIVVAFISIVRK